ncbi:restriction endonuclease subunit S [Priestia megaterium]|uniref:restriction endonuclease subunit S n=1 Tax=Priestia megaterium TaxID=1404 RepID=UPI001CDCB5C3|nr:restriction endonuclease subunit S [Priestia megaterium]MCA4158015.1 restriction endonuclease subunit S [Priestia megaterium]
MEFKEVELDSILEINPKTNLKKGSIAKKIPMEYLSEHVKKIQRYEFSEFKSGSKFKNGDTLVARITPCLENGKTAYVDVLNDEEVAFGSTEFFVVRAKPEKADPQFIYYLMRSSEVRDVTIQSMTGTSGRQRAQKEAILGHVMNIPTLDIQKRIGYILSLYDEKIETNKETIKILEKISQNLFKHWFIDFEFPNEQGQSYKSNNGEMVKSELGEIPKGWKVITIKDICDVNKGSLSKKDDWAYINYLDTSNITKNSIQNIQFIDTIKDKVPSRAKRKVQPNDIIYSTVRPNQHHYGMIKKPVENMVVSTGFTVLRSRGMYSNDLVYLWLTQEEAIDNLQAIAEQSTSAYPSIKSDDILSMKILLPPQEILDALNEVIETQNKAIWNYHQENKKLSELRNTLLPKLLSGEIEMPNELVVN